ncbi:MAG: T9SS type A sorting domain-containing protein [Bacteroidetes bacterium]|jgi:hypothetical protein|nr:T9SS type A sorting domain-containing protein [Bacteroidota bacterium]
MPNNNFILKFIFLSAAIAFVSSKANALYYRSAQSGNWNVASTWESSVAAGGPWAPAASAPSSADQTITIQTGHWVLIVATLTMDEVVIDPGATLSAKTNATVTINNGTGTDLIINGTFVDSLYGASSISFNAGATWKISGGANFIKYTASSSNNWQSNYQSGIINIPANANWIVRKVGTLNPAISTTNGGTQAYYPNFIYENYTSTKFITSGSASSYFNGSVSYPIIKGNFDIGGAGTNYVDFTSDDLNSLIGVQVRGDMIVRTGNVYNNTGTGTEIWGDLYMDGTWTYDASDARILQFAGTGNSTVWGSGKFSIFTLTIAKTLPANVTLNRTLLVDSLVNFTTGIVYTSAANLLAINTGATVSTVSNNNSYVEGPCLKYGSEGFVFPVGKGGDVQPAGISASAAPADSGVIWYENFNNGCSALCDANGYTGINGTWTTEDAGPNGNRPNKFYVSCAEANRPINSCAGGCATGGDATLHISTSPCASCTICPTGDCGAVYDTISSALSGTDPTTNVRAISPPINTLGKTNLNIKFKYINVGDFKSPASSPDKAILEYSLDNGITWNTFLNIGRSSSAGGCTLLKKWAMFTGIPLPATCNNLSNLRIAFRWINDNNQTGATQNTNGSFAVDSVEITGKSLDSYTTEYFHVNPTVVYNNIVNAPLKHVSRMEYWYMSNNAGTGKRKVTLYWDGNSGGVTSLPDLRVARFNGGSWDNLGNTGTTGSVAAGTITSDSTADFGPVTLASVIPYPGNPLPVELINFDGKRQSDYIQLHWVTSSEKNNDYFTIQKSLNGQTYSDLARVSGAGTTNNYSIYYLNDEHPAPGINYYKLFQTDFDGTTVEKAMTAVRYSNDIKDFIVIPDRQNQQIIVQMNADAVTSYNLRLTDASGKLIRQIPFKSQTLKIDASLLANGVYFISVQTADSVLNKRIYY